MSPVPTIKPASAAALARLHGIHVAAGERVREARLRRRWTVDRLAREAGLSRRLVYLVERGDPASVETYVRLGTALGLRVEVSFEDRRSRGGDARAEDPVHATIVEVLAGRYARPGRLVTADDPFQHYQFAGRADLAVINPVGPDLLHHEVKSAMPNIGELAGAWNVKRQYLARVLAERHGLRGGFRSVTHVLTIAWTAECLRTARRRRETLHSLGPDDADAFGAWWNGTTPEQPVVTSTAVFLDPVPRPRAAAWVPLGELDRLRPRHADYAELLAALRAAGLA
jgi:transcriptional regulator with XRE-family HTH domain